MERDGAISVFVPQHLTDEEIHKLVNSKLYQIYKHMAEWEDANTSRVYREFVNGEGFLYLGRTYRLEVIKGQKVPLKLKNGYFLLNKSDLPSAKQVFIDFYKERGRERINERVVFWAKQLGVNPKEVRVMELKNRWGSCSEKGTVNFHWKCTMAPLTIIDYIIAHELTHLIHPNHTDAFWNQLDKVMPDFQERKSWLKLYGAGMDL